MSQAGAACAIPRPARALGALPAAHACLPDSTLLAVRSLSVLAPDPPLTHKDVQEEGVNFDIVLLEQSARLRFNRGALLNAGVLLLSGLDHDYFVFNDVDTVPAKGSGVHYAFPDGDVPLHVTPPGLHPKYSDNEVRCALKCVRSFTCQ